MKRFILWTVGIVIALLVIVAGTICFASAGFLRQVAGEKASAKLGREFTIDSVHIDWSWNVPEVHLQGIKLANAPELKDPDMVQIDEVDFHIRIWKLLEGQLNLPDITIVKPYIVMEKIDNKTKNWDFPALSKANAVTTAALPSHRSNFPVIDRLTIQDGKMTYRDDTKNLDVTLDIGTAKGGGGEKGAFTLGGQGMLQGKAFTLDAQGGTIAMLRETAQPYPLHVHIQMGDTVADVIGTFTDPVKMEGVDAKLDLRGSSMSDLFYLTLLPLPPTPTYSLGGHLLKTADVWTFEDFKGKVGDSDLEGHLTYDISQPRGYMKAQLTSHKLDMKDLAGFLGATPAPRAGEKPAAAQVARAEKEKAAPRLIPDVKLDLTRLRATDLDVTLQSHEIVAPGFPMDHIAIGFHLKDGVLTLNPLDFGIASGQIAGNLVLDGSKDVPHMETDLMLTKLALKQFLESTPFAPLSSGSIAGHFQIAGDGKSLAEVMSGSNGRVTFVMSGGTISQLLVDAAGLDVGGASAELLGKDKSTDIRCMVSDFDVGNGVLQSRIFVFDTGISHIGGNMHVNLKDESIDAKIKTEPKNVTVTVHAPIVITGSLKHPSVSLDVKETAARGAGAAVLSVFLTPLAAIIPFIELGLGKDSNCAALIGAARSAAPPPPPQNP